MVEYYPTSRDEGEAIREVATVVEIYGEHIPSEAEAPQHRSLDIIQLRQDGERITSLSVSAELARSYNAGEIDREEYIVRVVLGLPFGQGERIQTDAIRGLLQRIRNWTGRYLQPRS